MTQEFWHERWNNDQIGFHQPNGQPLLAKHWPTLALVPASRILVPLCGKSQDMVWLAARGHRVTGIELSGIAARDFFVESNLDYKRVARGPFDCYVGEHIEIRVGDLFDLERRELAVFEGFYDRAALIALPENKRRAYVDHLMGGLRRGATGLLITFAYDRAEMEGPPYSVGDEDVGELYGRYAHVDLLAERRGLSKDDRLRKRGLTDGQDAVYRIVRR